MPTKPREDWRSRALRAEGVILELRAALNAAEARAGEAVDLLDQVVAFLQPDGDAPQPEEDTE